MNGARETDSKILVIEGEPKMGMLLQVAHAADGPVLCGAESVVDTSAAREVDFIVLDMKLPGIGKVVESLRKWSDVPIVITSIERAQQRAGTRRDDADAGSGERLDSDELLADIRTALECLAPGENDVVANIGELSVNLSARLVTSLDEEVVLTPTEFELLKLLILNSGHVVSHEELLETIWGSSDIANNRRLRIMVHRLREKIEPDPARPVYIKTQQGIGYRLSVPRGPSA